MERKKRTQGRKKFDEAIIEAYASNCYGNDEKYPLSALEDLELRPLEALVHAIDTLSRKRETAFHVHDAARLADFLEEVVEYRRRKAVARVKT